MSRILCSLLLVMVSLPAFSEEHILTPMFGYSKWSDSSGHTARGSGISFGDENRTTFGFRYLFLFDNNIALGANIYSHDLDVTTPGRADNAGIAHVHALAEYFLTLTKQTSIFLGAGYGFSAIGFSGGNLNEKGSGGASYELNGGMLLRLSETFGVQLEYKYTSFDIDANIDSQQTNIDSTSNSFLLGLTIHL